MRFTAKSIVQRLEPLLHEDLMSKLLSSIHDRLSSGVSPDVYTPRPITKSEGLISQKDKKHHNRSQK